MIVPKHIKSKINKLLKLRSQAAELENEVYRWLDDNGVDTRTSKWEDGMSPRLSYSEFDDGAEQFETDLNKYLNGETVGHG